MIKRVEVRFSLLLLGTLCALATSTMWNTPTASALATDGFSIQVTPSPLVATLKPGQQTNLELKVYNSGTAAVDLHIEARDFSLNDKNASVSIDDTSPARISNWIGFKYSEFSVQPGQWFTQTVSISLPKDTGFSYHFAIVISQKNVPLNTESTRLIQGSVAIFTLINVDRPGATRELQAVELQADKQIYEYLPAKISVKFKNTGNSVVQPYGNIFIQRSSDDNKPIATLPVNENKGYILPGSIRELSTKWETGFPRLVTDNNGNVHEQWDWSRISEFRFGQYTVKLVGVYNDGGRDVPLEAEITFWVLPWKILLGLFVVIMLVGIGIWSLLHKALTPLLQRRKRKSVHKHLGLQD